VHAPGRAPPDRTGGRSGRREAGIVDHVFHLAAVYDMTVPADVQQAANVDGTRHVVDVANRLRPRCFHHVSSIAVAGTYRGTFREDMLDEATGLDHHPYFATSTRPRPWRGRRAPCRGASTGPGSWSATRARA
jgi:nucleoside-diphosphate-sugar epimerase